MVESRLIGGSSSGRTQAFGAWYEGSNPSPPAIGIDIGGTKIRAILWNGKKVLRAREIKTPGNLTGFKEALRKLVLERPGRHLATRSLSVGIAVPGRVRGNVFVSATNIAYIKNLNFSKIFSALGGSAFGGKAPRVKIDHDARCFAGSEYKDKQTTFFLTLGTGVGRAIGKRGKILKIKKFEYSERWENEYKKIRDSNDDTALAKFLAKKLNKLTVAYGIKLIIVGGGVSTRRGFLAKLQKVFRMPVKKSKFGKNSVAIGAAMLF